MTGLKAGVHLASLQPQMVLAFVVAYSVANDMGLDLVVTSANDSQHMKGSLHYSGKALDFRTHDWPEPQKTDFVTRVRANLGGEFDVLLESPGGANEHMHVEWDVKGGV